MTIAGILKRKGSGIVSIAPTATVAELARLLTQREIGAVIVQDEGGKMVGIVSERDVVHALARHDGEALAMTAADLMTRKVKTAGRETTVEQALVIMSDGHFRHLPVVDDGDLLGIVSIRDVMETRIIVAEHEAESLKTYMAGSIYSGQL